MAFDPLAFMKPGKAFSMEGLLSRDMFEKFAASDEDRYNRIAFGTDQDCFENDKYPGFQSRWHFLAKCVTDDLEEIVDWINQWESVYIEISPTLLCIYGVDGSDSELLSRLKLNDGAPLTPDNEHQTLSILMKQMKTSILGVDFSRIEKLVKDGVTIHSFTVKRASKK